MFESDSAWEMLVVGTSLDILIRVFKSWMLAWLQESSGVRNQLIRCVKLQRK